MNTTALRLYDDLVGNNFGLSIYFSDLNPEAQQRVLDFYGLDEPNKGDFLVPLFTLEKEDEGENID